MALLGWPRTVLASVGRVPNPGALPSALGSLSPRHMLAVHTDALCRVHAPFSSGRAMALVCPSPWEQPRLHRLQARGRLGAPCLSQAPGAHVRKRSQARQVLQSLKGKNESLGPCSSPAMVERALTWGGRRAGLMGADLGMET